VLNWLNPFKWWQIFQQNRRWQAANRQFIHHYHQGDFATAETVGNLMVDIATKSGKRKFLLDSYYNLMVCYRGMEQLEVAIDYGEQVLNLQRSLSSNPEDPLLVERMCDLAELLQQEGRLDEGIKLYGQALTIRKRIDCDKGSKQTIEILESLAAIYVTQSNGERADKLFNEAQLHRRKLGLVLDPKVADLESAIAQIKSRHRGEHLTDLERWRKLSEEVVKLHQQGEISSATPIAEEALQLARNVFPSPNNDLATSLNNLALLYESQGRWGEAEPLYDEALKIYRELFGKKPNNYLATSLNNLAELYKSQGRWGEAEPLYDEALKIRRKLFGKNANNDLAASLNNLAELYQSQGRWREAEPLFDEALKIRRELFGKNANNDLAMSLNNLAGLYRSQGRWGEAEPLFDEALKIRRELFGETGHPDLVIALINLALFHAQQQQHDLALPLLQEAIESENTWLTNIIAVNDAQQRIEDLEQREDRLEYLLALTQQYFLNDSQVVTETFNAVLSRKAQAATAEATFSQALRNHPELSSKIDLYKNYQEEIVTLSYAIASQPELKDRLNTILHQKRDLEKKLARSIPAIDLAQQVIDRQALTNLLPADAFLVEFIRYRDYDFIKQTWQTARYLAFIVERDLQGVTAIDCGLAEPLDTAIDNFRSVHAQIDYNSQNSGVFDVFEPELAPQNILAEFLDLLLPHFPPTGTCYLAPDSKLHILPFHLLKSTGTVGEGEYLGDRYPIHHLTTARDLYRRQFKTSSNPPLILANPDYDGGTPTSVANPKTGRQLSHEVDGKLFERLEINQILGDSIAARYQADYYSGVEATVDRLTQLNAPRLLVIATHGFSFTPQQNLIDKLKSCKREQEEGILRDRRKEITQTFRDFWQAQADTGDEWSQQLLVKIDNIGISQSTDLLATATSDPMLRSGIALAGANIWRFQGTETEQFGKGVVFAHDIAQWDLWGNELTIFVACKGAMGEVKNSEGVFGLRRALAIAGAKYVITSLWNIPTKPSVLLMNKFFELYQSAARPTPPEALAAAQLYVRNINLGELKQSKVGMEVIKELQTDRVRGLRSDATDDVKPLADPHYWGAWICQG
jgi:tetratricopeptide (TPR) repeat protein/CHAT domain-containing protein